MTTTNKQQKQPTKPTQLQVLEKMLRGTGKTITATEASTTYGIKRLSARMYDMRKAGLVVKTKIDTKTGRATYTVNQRTKSGSRKPVFGA